MDTGFPIWLAGWKKATDGSRSEAEMEPVSSIRDSDREVGEVLLSEATIDGLVRKIGAQITTDYAGRQPLLLGVLKGAVVFLADLMRAIDLPTEIDFLAVSSYGASTTHLSKLLPRIRGGGGAGCPILVFGIKKSLYVQDC